jgi:hypothetical protein
VVKEATARICFSADARRRQTRSSSVHDAGQQPEKQPSPKTAAQEKHQQAQTALDVV